MVLRYRLFLWEICGFSLFSCSESDNLTDNDFDNEEEEENCCYNAKAMFPLAVATSIDALAVGVSFAFLSVDIVPAVSFIGLCTFVLSFAGVKVGSVFGSRFKSKAELAGGVILILIGLKILLEHIGFINF